MTYGNVASPDPAITIRDLEARIDGLVRERAELKAEIERLKAEVERLRVTLRRVKPGVMLIAYEDGDHQRLVRVVAKHQRRADAAEAEIERHKEAMDVREFEAYQIISNLAERMGVFEHPEVIRALDWFAYPDDRPDEIFPWPNGGLTAIPSTAQHDLPPTRAEEQERE